MPHFRTFMASSLLALTAAAPAAAQSIDRVVAFGDSYADTGNLKAILGPFFPSDEYPTGRFSGGTNFVDSLAAHYNVPELDFAVGGAEAGSGNVVLPGLPGFQQQWQSFVASGQTFSPNDLLALSVGGNDARGYRTTGTLAGADAAATATAAEATTGIDALVKLGVKRMVFIVGDTGQLPEAIGQANAAIGTAFSVDYNAKMQVSLAPIAKAGTTVAYVDITQIGNVVRADPARFGFIDVTHACPQTCLGNPALQSQYFFYVDGVHLTSAAFALVADYAINALAAPYSFRANGDLPLLAAQNFGRSLNARLDLARGHVGKDGLSTYGFFTGDGGHRDSDGAANGYDYRSWGGLGGVEYRAGPAMVGAMFSYDRSHDDSIDADRTKARSYQIGGYGQVAMGPLFAQGYAGYGWHHLDITRTGVADPLTASPHAKSWVAGGRAGYLSSLGPVRIGPVVGLDYAHSKLDGYTETGDVAAALIVGSQHVDTLIGSAGAELRYALLDRITPWVRLTAEKTLEGDGRSVYYANINAPGVVNGFAIPDSSKKVYGAVAGGMQAALTSHISLEATIRTDFSRKEGDDTSGVGGVRLSF